MERSLTKTSIIIIILLAATASMSFPKSVHASLTPVIGVFSSQYSSSNITDTGLVIGSTFSVQVNVTHAPIEWNGYEFVLYYDQRYIAVISYDYTTNTVFPLPFASSSTNNSPGALRMSVVNEGPVSADSGLLVDITFKVLAVGVSPLVLAAGMAEVGSGAAAPGGICPTCAGAPNWSRLVDQSTLISVDTSDGYFKNIAGVSGPVASFKFSPAIPPQGSTVTFYANYSFDPDNFNSVNHGVVTYFWDFGDSSGNANITTTSPNATHVFTHGGTGGSAFTGNFSIRLTVQDADQGFQGMHTQLLTIALPPSHCVEISAIIAKSQIAPGPPENVQIQVANSGTFSEEFNLTVQYGQPNATSTLPPTTGLNIAPGKIVSYPFSISTANLAAATYNIVAKAALYGYANCPLGTSRSQFSVVFPGTGSPVLILAAGVALLVSVATVGTFLARRRRKPEPP